MKRHQVLCDIKMFCDKTGMGREWYFLYAIKVIVYYYICKMFYVSFMVTTKVKPAID